MAIRHKRTTTTAYSWQSADLVDGQIGINTTDGTLHFKKANGTYVKVSDTTGFGAGTVTSVAGSGTINGLTLTGTVTSTGNLTLGGTLDLSSPPAIGATTAAAGTFTTMTATTAALKDVRETVYAIGNSSTSTLTPDAANGSVQTITATGNFTLSAFSNPVSGQTITFIITQDATGSRTLTSTMKFAGASKTLSTAANSIDILTVSYIGTTYYASLAKGFA